jgi:hypothetical protein
MKIANRLFGGTLAGKCQSSKVTQGESISRREQVGGLLPS